MTITNLYMQAAILEENIAQLTRRLDALSQIDCDSLERLLVYNLVDALKATLMAWTEIVVAIENKAI